MMRQYVCQSFCLVCQGCCRFRQKDSCWQPKLLNEEKKKLLTKVYLVFNSKENNFVCSSLNLKNNQCKIYSQRPLDCRLYPFLLNRKKNKVYLAVDLNCPQVKKDKIFQDYVHYLLDFLNQPKMKKAIRDNPQIIQTYNGVLNLSEIRI